MVGKNQETISWRLAEKFEGKQQEGLAEEKKPGGGTRQYSNELKKRTKRIKSGKKVGKRQTEKHASITKDKQRKKWQTL